MKWSNVGNGIVPFLHLDVVAIEKASSSHPGVKSTTLLFLRFTQFLNYFIREVCTHTHTHTYTHTHTHTYIYIYIYIYMCVHVCVLGSVHFSVQCDTNISCLDSLINVIIQIYICFCTFNRKPSLLDLLNLWWNKINDEVSNILYNLLTIDYLVFIFLSSRESWPMTLMFNLAIFLRRKFVANNLSNTPFSFNLLRFLCVVLT